VAQGLQPFAATAGSSRCRPAVHGKPACSRHEQHRGTGSAHGEGEAEDIGVLPQQVRSSQSHHDKDGSVYGRRQGWNMPDTLRKPSPELKASLEVDLPVQAPG